MYNISIYTHTVCHSNPLSHCSIIFHRISLYSSVFHDEYIYIYPIYFFEFIPVYPVIFHCIPVYPIVCHHIPLLVIFPQTHIAM